MHGLETEVERHLTSLEDKSGKRFGKQLGRRRNWKKAYVRLAEGQEINFAAQE